MFLSSLSLNNNLTTKFRSVYSLLSDSAEDILTLTMSELEMNTPRPTPQPSLPTSPTPPPLSSLKPSSTSSELVDFPDNGFDFYSFSFDNSFPYRGILGNERSFSCSSPTSNTSFLAETSFSPQSHLRKLHDSGNPSDSFGLLTTTSSPYREIEANHSPANFQCLLNGLGEADLSNNETEPPPQAGGSFLLPSPLPTSQGSELLNDSTFSSPSIGGFIGGELGGCSSTTWEPPSKTLTSTPIKCRFNFSFPNSESARIVSDNSSLSSGNGSSDASADSPTRFIGPTIDDSGPIPCTFTNQWNSSDVSSLLDDQNPESSSSSSVITTSALGKSIWNTPSQVSAACTTSNNATVPGSFVSANNKFSGNSQLQDEHLKGLSKQQLLAFVDLLKSKFEENVRFNDTARAAQIQGAMVQVQDYIINSFVSDSSESVSSATSVSTPTCSTSSLLPSPTESTFDRAVKLHREIVGSKDAPYTWSGQLPPRLHRNPTYSCKVFLGGLPWDINEGILMQAFKPFGILNIEWPGKEGVSAKPKGYAYAVFENEKQVKLLLDNCTHDYNHSRSGNYYFKISSKKYRGKDVQIIPWALNDSNFNRCQDKKIDPHKTIFVGALHGMINAEGLATIMQDLFGGVVYAGIDTDRKKYPIGSARVTFSNTRSYMKAVTAAFVLIKTNRFEKKLQVDPYLEDATCSICNLQQGPYFCRDRTCFTYYCRTCFQYRHSECQYRNHSPMMRTNNTKSAQQQQQGNIFSGTYGGQGGGSGFNNGGGGYNQYQHSSSYCFGSGNNHHNNNLHNSAYHGFGNHNRSWSNNYHNNIGRNTPPVKSANGETGQSLTGMNGWSKKYMNGGGHLNGGLGGVHLNTGGTGEHLSDGEAGNMNGAAGGNINGVGGGNMNGGIGGHMNGGGGGGNNINSNGHGHQQLPFTNRTFGQVGHRQQHQFMRW